MMNSKIPKLRFKEFSGEWEEDTLGNIVKFLDGKRKPIKESDRASMQGEYPYYGASGIIDYVNDYIFDEDLILLGEDGENIVSRNSPLVFKVSGKCWINNHAHVLKPNKPHDLDFFVQYMETLSYLKYNSGAAQPKLNQAVCKTIPLIFPKQNEQQKIANCLTSLDNLIEAQTNKVETIKEHKKGMIQQLFPKDGERVPKLRFNGFNGEWQEKNLGNCLDYLQPTKYLVDSTAYNDTYKTPVLTAGKTFILGYTDETYGVFSDKLPVIIFDDFTTATKFVNFPFKAKSSAMKILLAKDNIDIKFMYEVMQVINYQIGAHQRHWISKFAKLDILIPKEKEQQKIANCLSSIDNLIEEQNKKIKALKQHKRGLMQQLFVNSKEN